MSLSGRAHLGQTGHKMACNEFLEVPIRPTNDETNNGLYGMQGRPSSVTRMTQTRPPPYVNNSQIMPATAAASSSQKAMATMLLALGCLSSKAISR